MSALRVCVVVALCACLAVCVRGQDPTSGCNDPQPAMPYGDLVTDVGYWDLIGLQSTYSSSYNVMCSFSGLYLNGPAGTNTKQFGPWHGNPNDTNCGPINLSQFSVSTERGIPNKGNPAARLNTATGMYILTKFLIDGTCDNSDQICAGNCPSFPDYDASQDEPQQQQQQQPTATSYAATPGAGAPSGTGVVTRLNATQITGNVTASRSPYNTAVVSAITTFTKCLAVEDVVCQLQSQQSQQGAN